jgi:hypothetical protein
MNPVCLMCFGNPSRNLFLLFWVLFTFLNNFYSFSSYKFDVY